MCAPISQASNFLFYFHSVHVARKIITKAYVRGREQCCGGASVQMAWFLRSKGLIWGFSQPKWCSAGPGTMGGQPDLAPCMIRRGAASGELGWGIEGETRSPSAPDARRSFDKWSVLSMHRRGQACEKPACGCRVFTVRRPDKQALGRQSTNEVNWEMLLLLPGPP